MNMKHGYIPPKKVDKAIRKVERLASEMEGEDVTAFLHGFECALELFEDVERPFGTPTVEAGFATGYHAHEAFEKADGIMGAIEAAIKGYADSHGMKLEEVE